MNVDPFFPTKLEVEERFWPNFACIELTRKCPATCKYCFANSSMELDHMIPRDKMLELIDQLQKMDYRQIYWEGGDPLLHPDLFEIVCYAGEKGIGNGVFTSGLPITEKVAKKLYELHQHKVINEVDIHLDTINQEIFSRLHANPKELNQRIRGYRHLLDQGYPPERITPCITLTSASAETVEETIDWFYDQMGATRFFQLQVFNPLGQAKQHPELEPSLSQVRRAYEYRASGLSLLREY